MAMIIDFETRSRCDLKKHGVYAYATHNSTEILCMAWWLTGAKCGGLWWPKSQEMPRELRIYFGPGGEGMVYAHNAAFERLIWEHCGPDEFQIAFNRWYCTAAQARVNALPDSLADATRALTGESQKDPRGKELIKLLCVPDNEGNFNDSPALMKELGDYCLQDVKATAMLVDQTRTLTPREHNDWLVNEVINDYGIKIDRPLAQACADRALVLKAASGGKLDKCTHGRITQPTQHARIGAWVHENLPPALKQIALKFSEAKGEWTPSADKEIRAELLLDPRTPGHVKEFLDIVEEGSTGSAVKFQAMVYRADVHDSRVCGAFVFAGAGQTLRYASRGLQLHNMKRDCFDPTEARTIRRALINERRALSAKELTKLLRPSLIPERGNCFVVGDWSSIEARALPWLSKQSAARPRLELFKQNKDIYQITADALGLRDRQMGKVAELSLGYGGANNAFHGMAKNYGLVMDDHDVTNLVRDWRDDNQWAVRFWNHLTTAAMAAVNTPLQSFHAGRVFYLFYPALMGGTLTCTLPCGTILSYPQCRVEVNDRGQHELTALKASKRPAYKDPEWARGKLWHGLLAENITQAACASLLREKLAVCDVEDVPVVGHVHDEIIVECGTVGSTAMAHKLQTIMEEVPSWARGLPLRAVPQKMSRYGK